MLPRYRMCPCRIFPSVGLDDEFSSRVAFVTAVAALIVLDISIPFLPGSQTGEYKPESILVFIA